MATLDIILLICFIPGIIRGISKGFLEQALSLAGIVLSVWAAFKFSALVCGWLKPYLSLSETTLNVVAFALILIAVSIVVLLVAKLLTKVLEMSMLGWLDKILGLAFALVVNALLLGVFVILFDTLNLKFGFVKPEVLDGSVVYTTLRDFCYLVFPYLKAFFFKQ
ncbi:MAG: CvpA family protein [Bacteroidales bacterium]|nr:CvpA family protein [Bacteroidales bacterium]MBR2747024.1 CvpA family protein [Bacteroidales bacterium]MBR3096954.1 CvpA family protein [Bacteroidales bacterium]MBR4688247.1 CvpA family protein [Bacteroidales bacterium]